MGQLTEGDCFRPGGQPRHPPAQHAEMEQQLHLHAEIGRLQRQPPVADSEVHYQQHAGLDAERTL